MKQSTLKGIYLRYSIITSAAIVILTLFGYGFYGQTSLKEIFWSTTVGRIPLSLILLGMSIAIGTVVGLAIELYVNRSLHHLSLALLDLERGNFSSKGSRENFKEFQDIEGRYYRLAKKLEEQAMATQKKTNERQELLENAVSQERSRLARELHDSVSQQLFAISMMSSAMNEVAAEDTPLKKQLQVVENMSIQAQGEMRALLLHLRPIQLEGKKLEEGINELLTELSAKQHTDMVWHVDAIELEKGVEDHLFRILQEAISNTLRHGKAKQLEVRLRKIPPFAMLKVIDDGVGFDPKVRKAGSYGLDSMQERVNEIGGNLKIMSIPGKGTQIEVKVPLQERSSK